MSAPAKNKLMAGETGRVGRGHHHEPERECNEEDGQIDEFLTAEAHGLGDQALELREGDEAAAEGHRADEGADGRHCQVHEVGFATAIQFHGRDRRRRAASHAVVERDHLRHLRPIPYEKLITTTIYKEKALGPRGSLGTSSQPTEPQATWRTSLVVMALFHPEAQWL